MSSNIILSRNPYEVDSNKKINRMGTDIGKRCTLTQVGNKLVELCEGQSKCVMENNMLFCPAYDASASHACISGMDEVGNISNVDDVNAYTMAKPEEKSEETAQNMINVASTLNKSAYRKLNRMSYAEPCDTVKNRMGPFMVDSDMGVDTMHNIIHKVRVVPEMISEDEIHIVQNQEEMPSTTMYETTSEIYPEVAHEEIKLQIQPLKFPEQSKLLAQYKQQIEGLSGQSTMSWLFNQWWFLVAFWIIVAIIIVAIIYAFSSEKKPVKLDLLTTAGETITSASAFVGKTVGNVAEGVGKTVSSVSEGVKTQSGNIVEFLKKAPKDVTSSVQSGLSDVVKVIQDTSSEMGKKIGEYGTQVGEYGKQVGQQVGQQVSNIGAEVKKVSPFKN